jgi:phosphoenolpyruvate carboxykinase (GTP)
MDPRWEDPEGVPIQALVFGGRLTKSFPLVYEALDFRHGVFMAATMGSEATAAAFGQAAIRRDPFAMLPFAGYHMADYWRHWLGVEAWKVALPRIYRVNWFRKDAEGRFLWPGYGHNLRVMKWIVDRVHGRCDAVQSPLGGMPRYQDLDWRGFDFSREQYHQLMDLRQEDVLVEAKGISEWFARFGDRLPGELEVQRQAFEQRARQSAAVWSAAE